MSGSVVGFDVGSLTSYIGAARGGGVDILANEVSKLSTPSFVAFNNKSRFLGSAAEQQMTTNIANTVTSFSRLMGKLEIDPLVDFERRHTFYRIVPDSQGRAVIEVTYNGEPLQLLPEQIFAMHLHKLAEIAESNLGTKVVDIVIGVPSYFTDRERRAVLDASRIAGLNCMRLVNETAAVGIAYGLTKKDLPAADQPSRNVVFVNMGNSNLQVAVVAFNAGNMKVISTACDSCLGGRDFDLCIFDHLAKEFENKHGLKLSTNTKARVRLLKSCEGLKRVMSTNSIEIPIGVEYLMDGVDFSSKMKREFFESLCEPLLLRIKQTMEKALRLSNLRLEEIYSVELVGGGTRIPAVKKLVVDVFGREGGATLNADEAVARGCAFQAAICSPAFKVREFCITDACPYSISLNWKPTDNVPEAVKVNDVGEVTQGDSIEVFKHLSNIPASKLLDFYRREDFTLTASYSHVDGLYITDPLIGSFKITGIVPQLADPFCHVRVKARVNPNGIFTISNAVIMERVEKEIEVAIEEAKAKASIDANNQTPQTEGVAKSSATKNDIGGRVVVQKPKTKIENRVVLVPRDVPVETTTSQLSHALLLKCTDFHAKLNHNDVIERERQEMTNALETYVYEIREKLNTCLLEFVTQAECESFQKALTETEDWLYGEGRDAKKSTISERLETLKKVGDRYYLRFIEADNRSAAINALANACENIRKVLETYEAGDPKYNHLTEEDMIKVKNALKNKQEYLDTFVGASNKLRLVSDPTVFVADLYNAKRELESICNPIISKPRPSSPPPPKFVKNSDMKEDEKDNKLSPQCVKIPVKVKGGSEKDNKLSPQCVKIPVKVKGGGESPRFGEYMEVD